MLGILAGFSTQIIIEQGAGSELCGPMITNVARRLRDTNHDGVVSLAEGWRKRELNGTSCWGGVCLLSGLVDQPPRVRFVSASVAESYEWWNREGLEQRDNEWDTSSGLLRESLNHANMLSTLNVTANATFLTERLTRISGNISTLGGLANNVWIVAIIRPTVARTGHVIGWAPIAGILVDANAGVYLDPTSRDNATESFSQLVRMYIDLFGGAGGSDFAIYCFTPRGTRIHDELWI